MKLDTFGDALIAYRDSKTPLKRGAAQERTRINSLQQDPIAVTPLAQLKRADIRALRDRVMATYVTGSTWNRKLALVNAVLGWCEAEFDAGPGKICSGLAAPENAARTRRLQRGEYAALLTEAGTHWIAAWIVLAVETTMRRGSIATLEWQHVDLTSRVAYLPKTKNGSDQHVPLSSRAVLALDRLRGMLPRVGRVFPFKPDAATRAFSRVCERCDIRDLRLHDLRAEGVSRLFEAGWSLPEVKAVSGHKSTAIMRYMRHNDPAALAQKMG